MKKKLPYIFIFDIDNCIIGNINYPITESILLDLIKMTCTQKKISNKCSKKVNFVNVLKKGLLRPYFINFVKFIKKKYKNVELYVYTNSSYNWTYGGLVENIEKASKIKFNKPYFTRENSYQLNDNFPKSLSNVFKIIISRLQNKYKILKNKKEVLKIFNNNVVFIDDIQNNLKDYPGKQIVCPKYEFNKPYDIIKKIKKENKIKNEIINHYNVKEYITQNIKSPVKFKDTTINEYKIQKFKWAYYSKKENNEKKDYFYKNLIKIIKNNKIKNFSFKNIELINNKINLKKTKK
tara:strand:+ start:146 stop:1024 length:879 start_codon:yes stop_codon:yes gene_type:complete